MIDLSDSLIQDRIAKLFPKDTPCDGGTERLAELQAEANTTAHPRKIMCLARQYRRVGMAL